MTQALSGPAATFPRAPRSAGGARQAAAVGPVPAQRRGVAGSTPSGGSRGLWQGGLPGFTGRPHSGRESSGVRQRILTFSSFHTDVLLVEDIYQQSDLGYNRI